MREQPTRKYIMEVDIYEKFHNIRLAIRSQILWI